MLSSLQTMLTGVLAALIAIPADNTQLPLALVLICLGTLSGLVLWQQLRQQGETS